MAGGGGVAGFGRRRRVKERERELGDEKGGESSGASGVR